MSDKPISPLRRRMIEDMTVRNFVEKTCNDYSHQRDPRGHEPVGSAHAADTGEQAAGISHGDHGSPRPGDRGYLPRLRARLA